MNELAGKTVLIVRPNGNELAELLSSQGAIGLSQAKIQFQEVVVYRSIEIAQSEPEMLRRLQQNEIDWVAITSSAVAEATIKLWGDLLRRSKLVSIGPATTARLEALGFPPTTQARTFDFAGIVQAMLDYDESKRA